MKLVKSKALLFAINNSTRQLKFGLLCYPLHKTNSWNGYSSTADKWNAYLEQERKYGKLIYKGQTTSKLKAIKIFSISTSLIGLGLVPYICTLQDIPLFAQVMALATTTLFTLCTPFFLQLLTRRHVNRLYYDYDKDKFTAFIFNFFLLEYKIEFSLNDIIVSDGIFTTFLIKNLNKRPLFVDYNQIYDVSLVEKILGYDKPLNLKKYDK
jgi:hypothetical protein